MNMPRQPVESGVPDHVQELHPVVKKNYGQWSYHERPKPGVLKHVAKSGDAIWTVRAGTPRQMSIHMIRELCDIADNYADGHVRFTIRSNIEFLLDDGNRVDDLIKTLNEKGYPVGGTGNSVSMVSHTQGWLHCDLPATDASGVVKALMDELYNDYVNEEMPNRVRLTTSCCEINCGGQGDIAINIQHTKPPRVDHDAVEDICQRPDVIARCPTAAIRPAQVNGKPSLEVDERKCVACGACFSPCPPMEINHPEHSKLAIWVGGKFSNARNKPMQMKMVAHSLPNNPPRWPEVSKVVKSILEAYKSDAHDWERMGEWIDRIGWKRFFEMTGLTFDKYMIDDWRHARATWNSSAHIRF